MQLCDLQCSRLWCSQHASDDLAAPDGERKGTDLTYLSNHGGKPENTKPREIFSPRRTIPSLAAAALVRGQAEDDYFLSISHEHRLSFNTWPAAPHFTLPLHCLSLSTSSSLCPSFMLKKESEGKRRRPRGRESERSWSE